LLTALDTKGWRATVIDGDALRATALETLGFTPQDRNANGLRAAALACAVAEREEVAICALISPYASTREHARRIVGQHRFVEVFVDTPLAVCIERDPKGLYARARRGDVTHVSGLDDPYEIPTHADLVVPTLDLSPVQSALKILELLNRRGYLFTTGRFSAEVARHHDRFLIEDQCGSHADDE
jgi:sulfate adenylyltransferase